MSKERRYQDHEIREILDLAIGREDVPSKVLPAADGLTFSQLQEVGREVGLSSERIADAVAEFEGRGEVTHLTNAFGLPTSIGMVVPLPRNPTDREWELIVAELRTTFGGKGEVTSNGGLREWTHGTLHAFLEPTETAYRLRLTNATPAVVGIFLGGAFLTFALLIFVVLLGKANPGFRFAVPAFFSLLGGVVATASALSLRRWAPREKSRMDHLRRYAVSLLARRDIAGD